MGHYTALYRKFRPLTFSEIAGQEHITTTLKNQVISNRVGHAYLFNGGRGTGKTSAAKILARAINCLNPKDGEPCNECEICKGAISGSLTDIVEMDAASNNSVEDIRDIREEVNFLPTKAKYRVYIIDEVHMLSTGAFNALLKTLEEPPEHVKFILATTEPQKIPATILSRCQRFDFKKLKNDDIVGRLEYVCKESEIKYTNTALKMIAELSDGAMRDALSILERCVQDGQNSIDEEKIRKLVGIPEFIYIHKITEGLIKYDIEETLETINEVLNEGKDVNNLIWEIIKYVKDILLYKTSKNTGIYTKEEIEDISKISEEATKEKLIDLIFKLSKLESDIKNSTQKTIMFQAGAISLCNKKIEHTEDIEKRIEKIEKYLKNGKKVQVIQDNKLIQTNNTIPYNSVQFQNNINQTSKATSKQTTNKPNFGVQNAKSFWPKVMEEIKTRGKVVLYTNLLGTTATQENDMTVAIKFPKQLNSFGRTVLEKQENKKEISDLVSIALGKEMQIKYISEASNNINASNANDIEKLAQGNDIPINIVE